MARRKKMDGVMLWEVKRSMDKVLNKIKDVNANLIYPLQDYLTKNNETTLRRQLNKIESLTNQMEKFIKKTLKYDIPMYSVIDFDNDDVPDRYCISCDKIFSPEHKYNFKCKSCSEIERRRRWECNEEVSSFFR